MRALSCAQTHTATGLPNDNDDDDDDDDGDDGELRGAADVRDSDASAALAAVEIDANVPIRLLRCRVGCARRH